MKLLFLNGVNLNLTGKREKGIYGEQSLESINKDILEHFKGHECVFFQSNFEGEIVEKIQRAPDEGFGGIVLNAGAFTHYSYAIHDAISSIEVPVVEVHMSNIFARDAFRHTSVLSDACKGVVAGFGKMSYILAAEALL